MLANWACRITYVQCSIRPIHASSNNLPVVHKHTTNGRLIRLQCQLGLQNGNVQSAQSAEGVNKIVMFGKQSRNMDSYHVNGFTHEALMVRSIFDDGVHGYVVSFGLGL